MASIYIFEGRIIRNSKRLMIYPPKEYQDKLEKLHGKKVKVIVIEESD